MSRSSGNAVSLGSKPGINRVSLLLMIALLTALLLILVVYGILTSSNPVQSVNNVCKTTVETTRLESGEIPARLQEQDAESQYADQEAISAMSFIASSETNSTQMLSASLFETAPLCFSEQPDYVYNDERLSIHIKEYQESELVYFVCDIQTVNDEALQVALSEESVRGTNEHTSDIARRHGAVLAINGDFYNFHQHGVIIRNGQLIRANNTTRHMLLLDQNGNLLTITDRANESPESLSERLLAENVRQTWEFGPALVLDGQAAPFEKSFDLISLRDNAYEPRTGIGQINTRHFVVVVVDGRIDGYSKGVSLSRLQSLFIRAGVKTAFNLDGGGATTLYFNGQVLNKPSSGNERSVSDIIFFR